MIFQVVDSMDGVSARGDYMGHIPGVVRPMLKWTTQHLADRESMPATA
jgi:lipopolysaccharide transport system ATP-binding protein